MADKPFERTIFNLRERPLSPDWNQLQAQIDRAIRDVVRNMFTTAYTDVVTGFLGGSLAVVAQAPAAMAVNIAPGIGFIDNGSDVPTAINGITGLDDRSSLKPLVLNAIQAITIDAAPSAGQSRYDIIEVKVDRRAENNTSRAILNTSTGAFDTTLVNKTLSFSLDGRNGRVVAPASSTTGIGYKVGVAATTGAQAVPATTTGYVKLATILVTGGASTIVTANITDNRTLLPTMAGEAVLRVAGDATTLASAQTYTNTATAHMVRAYCRFGPSGTLVAGYYNVNNPVAHPGTGTYTVTTTAAVSSYAVPCVYGEDATGTTPSVVTCTPAGANTWTVHTYNMSGALADIAGAAFVLVY